MRAALFSLIAMVLLPAQPAAGAAAQPPARATATVRPQPVDLELVLMTDASGSIDQEEAVLQRQGVAAAFRSPEVVRAIQNGALGRIAVAYADWAAEYYNRIVVDWMVISDKSSADAFANKLLTTRLNFFDGTAIGGAMHFGAELIEGNNFDGTRRTIDISGDGPDNEGTTPSLVRREIAARGITINGLPIVTPQYGGGEWGIYYGDLFNYYKNCIIAGRGSFAIEARGFGDFANAVRRKLVLEISDAAPAKEAVPGIVRAAAAPRNPAPPPSQRPLPKPSTEAADRTNCMGGGFF
jgi:hypothetical protein